MCVYLWLLLKSILSLTKGKKKKKKKKPRHAAINTDADAHRCDQKNFNPLDSFCHRCHWEVSDSVEEANRLHGEFASWEAKQKLCYLFIYLFYVVIQSLISEFFFYSSVYWVVPSKIKIHERKPFIGQK